MEKKLEAQTFRLPRLLVWMRGQKPLFAGRCAASFQVWLVCSGLVAFPLWALGAPVLANKDSAQVCRPAAGSYTVNFPEDCAVGEIGIMDKSADYLGKHLDAKIIAKARGKVTLPKGVDLCFVSSDVMGLKQPVEMACLMPAEAVTGVCLKNAEFAGSEITKLIRFKRLRRLDLTGTEANDEALSKLSTLHELECLIVDRTRVRGHFLADFAGATGLRHLNIEHNNITRDYLQELKNFPQLEWLNISNINLHDSDLQRVGTCTSLKFLDISNNQNLTDKCIASLKPLKKLATLKIEYGKFKAKSILVLKGLPITNLRIAGEQATGKEVAMLKQAFPKLNVVIENNKEESFKDFNDLFYAK